MSPANHGAPQRAHISSSHRSIPQGVHTAAAWSWRFIIIAVALGLVFWLLSKVAVVVGSLFVAALLTALLQPGHQFLQHRLRFPALLSSLTLTFGLAAIGVVLMLVTGRQFAAGFADISTSIQSGLDDIISDVTKWGLLPEAWGVQDTIGSVSSMVGANGGAILNGAMSFGSTAANVLSGLAITVFALIFFLKDGQRIWDFTLRFTPVHYRNSIDQASRAGWRSLSAYVQVQIFVAFVNAAGIGIGAWLLGIPMVLPLTILVFLGAFIPFIGAILSGAVAVLLALLTNDWVNALAMLAVVLGVQQLESNVLQPFIMGRAVNLHPLAVLLVVIAGVALMGLIGAIFAVPLLSFANEFVRKFTKEPIDGDPWDEPIGDG